MKADLHVHSYHSGYNHDLPFLRSRDCYSLPDDVYRTAKARGMDFVTITDHDSIDGCLEFLSRHPDAQDFIIGEEISCWLPADSGARGGAVRGGAKGAKIEVHLGAYGMTERAHREIQPLRRNALDVIAYLHEARIFFALNHLFHFYRDQMPLAAYLTLLDRVPALETRNGAMLPAHNALIEQILASVGGAAGANASAFAGAAAPRHAIVAGSDAHTLRRVGRTWTDAPGRTREEFLANIAAGRGTAHGQQGGTLPLAADIYGVIADYWLSLVGLRRHEISMPRRAFGLAFSVVSAPFEFIPLIVSTISKSREADCIERCAATLAAAPSARPAIAFAVEPTPGPAKLKIDPLAPKASSAPAPTDGATSFIPSPRLRGEGQG